MEHLRFLPAVCAVEKEYQILVPVDADSVMWAEVGGRRFSDASNGVMRSDTRLHRIKIPGEVLDRAGEYQICWQKIIDRKPYFPELEEICRMNFSFRPLPADRPLHIYHIADVHNGDEPALAAGSFFGEDLDLLILNGDVPDSSGKVEYYDTIYHLCSDLTHGEIPIVFSRGNHDLRGLVAEKIAEYIPTSNGNTYFTFRVGPVWGIVLDCGEDKPDTNPEYGGTVACHEFRMAETDFLKDVIRHAGEEYAAEGVRMKLVISHMPFACRHAAPFNIEEDTYTEWCRLLRENIRPDLFLAGHQHELYVVHPGDARDAFGTPCPIVVGTRPGRDGDKPLYTGTALVLDEKEAWVRFTDQDGAVVGGERIPLKK